MSLIKIFTTFTLITLITTSCGDVLDDVNKPISFASVTVVLNEQLQQLSDPTDVVQTFVGGRLQVSVKIDGGETHTMTQSGDKLRFHLGFPTLDRSVPHQVMVSVTYTLNSNPDQPLIVAQATSADHPFITKPNLTFSAVDFTTNFDQDLDGMPNLAELVVGGNPNSPIPTFLNVNYIEIPERQNTGSDFQIEYTVRAISPRPDATMSYSIVQKTPRL